MHKQRNEVNFKGENIFVGIDVHLKGWSVTILTRELHHKTFNQPADPSVLVAYLEKNFPHATYHSVYEAGFSGIWIHRELLKMNVNNIIVNPADVPTNQKEKIQKRDKVDCRKLAYKLRNGDLEGIYVHSLETMEARSLVRVRSAIVSELTAMKHRVKSMLHLYGVPYPAIFRDNSTHWTKRFIEWLESIEFASVQGKESMLLLSQSVKELRKILLEATRKIRKLSKEDQYAENFRLLRSVPGVGLLTAMTFLTEIEEITRFQNTDKLAGYVGLVPMCHDSGENKSKGEMTFRGNAQLRTMLIESAWTAMRKDPALIQSYTELTRRMENNLAIVRIARKVLNRIFHVLKYKEEYVYSVVK